MIVLSVLVLSLCYFAPVLGCFGFHITFIVFVFDRVYFVLLNMDRNSYATFWSDSLSHKENRDNYIAYSIFNLNLRKSVSVQEAEEKLKLFRFPFFNGIFWNTRKTCKEWYTARQLSRPFTVLYFY